MKAEKHLCIFLNVVRGTVYKLLHNLLALAVPKDKSLEEVLEAHYKPKPIVIAERFHFNRRHQLLGESIAKFIAKLRHLSLHCDFHEYLEETLRNRFVCGMHSETTQKRFLAEPNPKLQDALDKALTMEAAATHSKTIPFPANKVLSQR